jgi:hypothetical protein
MPQKLTYTIAYATNGRLFPVMQYLTGYGNPPSHDTWTDNWRKRHIFDSADDAIAVSLILRRRYPSRPIRVQCHQQGRIGRVL